MTERRCDKCQFWAQLYPDHPVGDCRLRAPSLVVLNGRRETEFPTTISDAWCGQFSPKPTGARPAGTEIRTNKDWEKLLLGEDES